MSAVRDRIRNLGGPTRVASLLEVEGDKPEVATVIMWAHRNVVPWKWRPAFEALEASVTEAAS